MAAKEDSVLAAATLLAAAFLLSLAAGAMADGCGSSGGSGSAGLGSGLPLMGQGATLPRVHGVGGLDPEMVNGSFPVDVEDYGVVAGTDIAFMEEHVQNMQWVWELQDSFDAWLDAMETELDLDDEDHMMNDGEQDAAAMMEGVEDGAPAMEGVEDAVPAIEGVEDALPAMEGVEVAAPVMEGVQDVAVMEGLEEVHQFDVLTAGEQVIFDVMFDIHHPNIFVDDSGFYRFRED